MIIIQYIQYSPPACSGDLLFSFSFSYCTQLSSVRECSSSYVLKPPCDLQVTRLPCPTNNSESLNSWINPADTLSPRNFETNPVTSAKDPRSSFSWILQIQIIHTLKLLLLFFKCCITSKISRCTLTVAAALCVCCRAHLCQQHPPTLQNCSSHDKVQTTSCFPKCSLTFCDSLINCINHARSCDRLLNRWPLSTTVSIEACLYEQAWKQKGFVCC